MERLIEFIGNNMLWVGLWFALLTLLLWNLFKDNLLGIPQLGPLDVTRRINNDNAIIIDLRKSEDFEAGHVIDSVNIPESDLTQRIHDLEKFRKKPIILCCQSGSISPQTIQKFMKDGHEDLSNMKGGILSWQRANLPLTRS